MKVPCNGRCTMACARLLPSPWPGRGKGTGPWPWPSPDSGKWNRRWREFRPGEPLNRNRSPCSRGATKGTSPGPAPSDGAMPPVLPAATDSRCGRSQMPFPKTPQRNSLQPSAGTTWEPLGKRPVPGIRLLKEKPCRHPDREKRLLSAMRPLRKKPGTALWPAVWT